MKALIEVHDPAEFQRITELLRSKGIPTIGKRTGIRLYRQMIFVCINDQFEDARILLDFPASAPKIRVNPDAFHRRASGNNLDLIADNLKWVLLVAVLFIVVVVAALGPGWA
jgi:hypothetical protein